MAERADERSDDRGRGARRLGAKDWLQIAALTLTIAAIVWRGGQMTERLEQLSAKVEKLDSAVSDMPRQIAGGEIQARELKVRVDGHDKEIANHEQRISRIEARGGRGN